MDKIQKECAICGKPFVPKTVNSIYCSKNCSEAAYRKKKALEKKEAERKAFLKDLGTDEDLLRRKGFSENDISSIKDGKVPDGYQVHHKYPLDDGGTNDFDNLVLIKNDPYHKAITAFHNTHKECSSAKKVTK